MNPTAPPRPGEELDVARLSDFARSAMPDSTGPVVVEQFPSGHSNLTYLVRVGEAEFVLRRPPFGTTVKSAHDMGREFRVLSKLWAVYPPAPRPAAACDDPSVIGAPFYLMERRRGFVVRREAPPELTSSPDKCRELSRAMADNLARLHAIDWKAAGLDGFGKPDGYVRRQVEGWSRRWADAQTEALPAMDELAAWLARRMPPESGAAVIHNDYKLDNLLLDPADPARIEAVLDWEMATIGDPLMDLGTALAYWVEAGDPPEFQGSRMSPTTTAGFLTRAEFVDRYRQSSGRAVPDPAYYYVFGLFKLAVILQQIYYRYVKGATSDDRFVRFAETVRSLAAQGRLAAERA